MRCFSLLRTVMCTLPSQQLAVFALAHNTYIACLLTAPKVDIEWCFVEGRPSAIHRLAAVLSARYGSSTANSRRGSGTRRGPISNAAQLTASPRPSFSSATSQHLKLLRLGLFTAGSAPVTSCCSDYWAGPRSGLGSQRASTSKLNAAVRQPIAPLAPFPKEALRPDKSTELAFWGTPQSGD
ncbi:hypothetical protein B0J18DRAFT_90515 [Chaetomium sp. MPI-SDFR-AT-0129]|nr:hypothetical protein B0J18DRAFT_90515 [Chaetomium sp. MPI-SDFR-AT-0129]